MSCTLYFGLPGSGKTTTVCMMAIQEQIRIERGVSPYKHVYCNIPIMYPGICTLDTKWLAERYIHDGALFIDEGTLLFDARDYKSFDFAIKQFVLLHRHAKCDLFFYCQSANSLDKRIREITDKVFYVHKGVLRRGITYLNAIDYNIAIPGHKDPAGDILEGYKQKSKWAKLLDKRFRRKDYYKYFDSWDCSALAEREECPNVLYMQLDQIDVFQDPTRHFFITDPSDPVREVVETGCL